MINGVGLRARLDARWLRHAPEEITAGEAVAGMILNGLGVSHRPVSCTPQFLAHQPLARLGREGVRAEMVKRFQLGRTLDEVHAYGGDRWWRARALAVCAQAGIAGRFNHLDTTSVALPGDEVPDRDEPALAITPGDSPAPRPDWTQAVFERMGAPDGGVPWMRHRWAGPASDTPGFQERAPARLATFRASPHPRSWVADAQLDPDEKAPHLAQLGLSTRLPGTLKLGTQVIPPALPGDTGQDLHARTRDQGREWCHDRMAQRWRVGCSQAALERAEARVNHACPRAAEASTPPLLPRPAQRVETPTQAQEAWSGWARNGREHPRDSSARLAPQRDGQTGRPTAATPLPAIAGQMPAQVRLEAQRRADAQPQTACGVLGTTLETAPRSDAEVIAGDKAPSPAEGGGRCRKDPWCLVASWVGKNPRRIQGLWMVLTLALRVYAVAPRRLRRACARPHETIPQPINPPPSRPTLRGVLHVGDGIERVRVTGAGQVRDLITGLPEVTITILHRLGEPVCHVYQWPSG